MAVTPKKQHGHNENGYFTLESSVTPSTYSSDATTKTQIQTTDIAFHNHLKSQGPISDDSQNQYAVSPEEASYVHVRRGNNPEGQNVYQSSDYTGDSTYDHIHRGEITQFNEGIYDNPSNSGIYNTVRRGQESHINQQSDNIYD